MTIYLVCVTYKLFIKLTVNKFMINSKLIIHVFTDYEWYPTRPHDYPIDKKKSMKD